MKRAGRLRSAPLAALSAALLCAVSSCVPWTVVPIEEEAATVSRPAGRFDPKAYVEAIWDAKLAPRVREFALDLASAPLPPKPALVHGEGLIAKLDSGGRTGRLLVDLAAGEPGRRVAILTGPVILGSVLRDAAGFLDFSRFANQLDYAAVAGELNRRAVEDIVNPRSAALTPGRTVRFWGAIDPAADPPEVVPVILEVE
jgi:predicted lipoprotein